MPNRRLPFVIALFVLIIIGWSSAAKGAGPPIQEQPNIPTPSVTPTEIPPSPTPTATPTARPTRTPTPTPTTDPAIEITAQHKVRRCLFYEGIMEQWISLEPPEFEYLTLNDVPLALAVGAAESGCDMDVVSSAGALGIMQVIPKFWTASAERLMEEPRVNIYWGLKILDSAIRIADGDVRLGLAYYNCSIENVHNDACGPSGGLNYADSVLEFWLPYFE